MSQQQQPDPERAQTDATPSMTSPSLSEYEARQAHEEALKRANRPVAGEVMAGAHGRVEEETRRLSERMTREEQERRKALALGDKPPAAPDLVSAPARLLPTPERIHSTLVALDGSPFAERALPYAAALAQLTGSELMLGTCLRHAGAPVVETIAAQATAGDARDGESAQPRRSLVSARAQLLADGVTTQASIVYAPDAADGLVALQTTIGAEALVVATHARTGIERAALGSVADEAVRRGRGFTLVIPPLAREAPLGGVTFARALVPLDGSALSEQTLRAIQPLLRRDTTDEAPARQHLSELTLFFVADDHAQIRDAEYYLGDLHEALLREATTPTTITTRVILGSAPGAIVAEAAGNSATHPTPGGRHDLIIMATHGRSGLGRWFYGSVAMYVLAHSDVPVLLVRASQTP